MPRFSDYPVAPSPGSDDYLLIDGATNKTRRIAIDSLLGSGSRMNFEVANSADYAVRTDTVYLVDGNLILVAKKESAVRAVQYRFGLMTPSLKYRTCQISNGVVTVSEDWTDLFENDGEGFEKYQLVDSDIYAIEEGVIYSVGEDLIFIVQQKENIGSGINATQYRFSRENPSIKYRTVLIANDAISSASEWLDFYSVSNRMFLLTDDVVVPYDNKQEAPMISSSQYNNLENGQIFICAIPDGADIVNTFWRKISSTKCEPIARPQNDSYTRAQSDSRYAKKNSLNGLMTRLHPNSPIVQVDGTGVWPDMSSEEYLEVPGGQMFKCLIGGAITYWIKEDNQSCSRLDNTSGESIDTYTRAEINRLVSLPKVGDYWISIDESEPPPSTQENKSATASPTTDGLWLWIDVSGKKIYICTSCVLTSSDATFNYYDLTWGEFYGNLMSLMPTITSSSQLSSIPIDQIFAYQDQTTGKTGVYVKISAAQNIGAQWQLATASMVAAKMDPVRRINSTSQIQSLPRNQIFECQGAVGFTANYDGSDYTLMARQASLDLVSDKLSDVCAFIGYSGVTDLDIAGLQVDFANNEFTRLASSKDFTPGSNFDRFNMYGGRRRCNVADDGTINAYYGDAGYKDDGTNGQVMVYQPAFWYRVVPIKLVKNASGIGYDISKANYYVSDTPMPGFKLHPLFYDENGNPVDHVLLSAYEGSMYDVSASAYVDDSSDTVTYASGDLLCSVAGKKPISGELEGIGKKDNFEAMANSRGSGWHLDTVKSVMANQLLMMIELGTLNSQTAIGRGIVDCSSVGEHNSSSLTGATSSLGNATGMASETTQSTAGTVTVNTVDGKLSITYRGVENPWGNLFKHVQGMNLWGDGSMNCGQVYICEDFTFSEQRHGDNYHPVGFYLPPSSGYISAFGYGDQEYDWVLLPSKSDGNSVYPVGDRFEGTGSMSGFRFAQVGGSWAQGTSAGMFGYRCTGGLSGNRKPTIGGRLLFIPTAVV